MSKKKGLGRDVESSIEAMENLIEPLKKFAHMPLKAGLSSNNVTDEKVLKAANEAMTMAFDLMTKVHDLKTLVRTIRTDKSSRFAMAQQVVSSFLQD